MNKEEKSALNGDDLSIYWLYKLFVYVHSWE